MKIIDIQTYFVQGSNDHWIWVSVKTDTGIEGWGEVTGSSNDTVLAQYIQTITKELIDKDPLNISDCMQKYEQPSFPENGSNRFVCTAWSGINQALWDIKSQYFGLPLYWLLGGYGEKKIPLYANLNRGLLGDRSPEALLRNGLEAFENGFSVIKCTPFDEVTPIESVEKIENGIARIKKLASKVPMNRIAIDCHQRLNRGHMARLLEALEEIGDPYWIEDPFTLEKVVEQESVYRDYPRIRWAAGETSYGIQDVLAISNNRQYDVIMPDVKHCGGVSAVKMMIPLIESLGLKVSLHNPSGPIATAFSAHLLTLASHPEPLEFPIGSVPERSEFLTSKEPIINGAYQLSDKPGIGIKPNYAKLAECSYTWGDGGWKKMSKEVVK